MYKSRSARVKVSEATTNE